MTFADCIPLLLQGSQIKRESAGGNIIFLFCDQLHKKHPIFSHFDSYALTKSDLEADDWQEVME